jgi:hypothetical protein
MKVRRLSLIAVAAPFISNCTCCGALGGFPSQHDVEWNGLLIDGGTPTGPLDFSTCEAACGNTGECEPLDSSHVRCTVICRGGRLPPGLVNLSDVDGHAGSWLSRMAEFEGAAVHAFAHLGEELDAHGLTAFARHARLAARQEIRHAVAMTRLALHHGYCPSQPSLIQTPLRSLADVAIDNAAEGCGRELFGALLNDYQATHAESELVRSTMALIASDEHEHARFSQALAEAIMPRLTSSERHRAREAQELAFERLAEEDVPPRVLSQLGLMDPETLMSTARALLETARL